MSKGAFYCGTSNVVLPVPNKSEYPVEFRDSSRLHYYSTLFNTVEINSSFYKLPMRKTVEKWAADVAPGFSFTFKVWKEITHAKGLIFSATDVATFMERVAGAGDKLGCLLVQLPAGATATHSEQLDELLDVVQLSGKTVGCRVAVELRERGWYTRKTYRMLDHYGAALVFHDMPKSNSLDLPLTSDFIYLRFHGEAGDYRGSYTDEFLREIAERVRTYIGAGKTVFAYFNNTLGEAVANALTLQKLCGDG